MTSSQAITRGLAYIRSAQLNDGSFASYSGPSRSDFSGATQYHTTFFSSLILSTLGVTTGMSSKKIAGKIADFLVDQKSPGWSLNYWSRDSQEAQELPYPDDLDDTFCALSALHTYKADLFDGTALATVAKLLITSEQSEGGPYRTWLMPATAPDQWRDVDVAVNANIGYFLHLQGVEMPSIVELIDQQLAGGGLQSPYYPDHLPIAYFVARWYSGAQLGKLQALLLHKTTSSLGEALRLSSLLRLGYPAKKLSPIANDLMRTQLADGSWPAEGFCIDPTRNNMTQYAGAASLTTALCIETLALYQNSTSPPVVVRVKPNPHYLAVIKIARRRIEGLPHQDLRIRTLELLEQIAMGENGQQIILLPWLVAGATKTKVSDDTLQNLALASLWGWMAYTTYDDFLDGEGVAHLLPSANYCLRQLTFILHTTLNDNQVFQQEVAEIMDRLDAANTWEVSHCRGTVSKDVLSVQTLPDYGDYWQLADRSLGHTIAGLGVLYAAGKTGSSRELKALRAFFMHYLIARQLNDDAHDWQEDLATGHINAVGVRILKQWSKKPKNSLRSIALDQQASSLQTIMWEHVITRVCTDIKTHCARAKAAIKPKSLGFDDTALAALLTPLESAATEALEKRDQARDFISSL